MTSNMTGTRDGGAALAAFRRRVDVVKARLQQDMRSLVAELVPRGRLCGQTWSAYPPHRDSDNPQAFAVYVRGAKAGGWIDFVSGEKGDALGLVMLVKGCTFPQAVAWAEERYGLRQMSDEQRAATAQAVARRLAVVTAGEAARAADQMRRACHMFSQAEAEIEGTLVDRYLLSRAIDLRALPHRERRWLRFAPAATYWLDPARPRMPAMIAGMVDGEGVMRAVHLTFLRGDGRGKAQVAKAKLMWPSVRGLVIRLNRGVGDLDCEDAAALGQAAPLLLGEGIEDGLSMAMAAPGLRIHAAGSLSNLGNMPDLACAASYVVARDNDWGKAQAAAGFERALDHLNTFRKPVAVIAASVGKDFNDQLMERAG